MNLSHNSLSLFFAFLLVGLVTFNDFFFSINSINSTAGLASVTAQSNVPASPAFTSLDPASGVTLPINVATVRSALLISAVGVSPPRPPAFPSPDGLSAAASLVYDLSTDRVLWVDNSSLAWPTASLAKIMTAIVVSENISADELITITPAAVAVEEIAGDFKPTEIFSVSDLISALFLVSSNDAAYALAEHYGLDRFLERMTDKASELGLSSTYFTDPAGLSPENVSTVRDLSRLTAYLYREHADIFSSSRLPAAAITDRSFGNIKEYVNINEFAGRPDFIGGKTGYTDAARGNLISVFNVSDHSVLIIVLGTEDRFGVTLKLLNWASSHPSLSTPLVL